MTIGAWVAFILLAMCIFTLCLTIGDFHPAAFAISIILSTVLLLGMRWYYTSTASGKRALTNEYSELNDGLERIVTVYTADGDIIAQYEGRIDIEGNDGGYVIFDFEGRRYTYYNCFVESIAIIE